jgi:hypothetical protein
MIKWILLLTAMATAEIYDNPSLNTHFETPAGWVMNAPDSTLLGAHFQVTRVGLKPVHIWIENWNNSIMATQETGSFLFWEMRLFYSRLSPSDYVPLITFMRDTVYSSGIRSSGFNLKQIPLDRYLVCYSSAFKTYVQKLCYETTPSDFDTNAGLYLANWLNLNYISLSSPTTKIAVPALSQSAEKKIFINILGQKLDPNSNQKISSTRLFNK